MAKDEKKEPKDLPTVHPKNEPPTMPPKGPEADIPKVEKVTK